MSHCPSAVRLGMAGGVSGLGAVKLGGGCEVQEHVTASVPSDSLLLLHLTRRLFDFPPTSPLLF